MPGTDASDGLGLGLDTTPPAGEGEGAGGLDTTPPPAGEGEGANVRQQVEGGQ